MSSEGFVYRLFDGDGTLLYIGVTNDIGRRWKDHLRGKSWAGRIQDMTVARYATYEAAVEAETKVIAAEYPVFNVASVPDEHQHVARLVYQLRSGVLPADPDMAAMLQDLSQLISDYLSGPAGRKAARKARNRLAWWRRNDAEQYLSRGLSEERQQVVNLDSDPDQLVIDSRQEKVRQIVQAAGHAGIKVSRILTCLDPENGKVPARETIQRWLAADEKLGLVRRGTGDSNWRWVGSP